MRAIDVLEGLSEQDFVENYVKQNRPVVVRDVNFEIEKWTPETFRKTLGDLPVQVYDTLFELQEVSTLAKYLDQHFGIPEFRDNVPYVRWYNRLKDVEHAWGDEAFARLSPFWQKPSFLPATNLLVPHSSSGRVDPVTDAFPYRGILIAAKGARTRLHRDPFCSDAIVSQFYGVKEFVLYHPDRTEELRNQSPLKTSYGGFVDVRPSHTAEYSPTPDFHGIVNPGDVVYVPHGWLHDVLVLEDSLSITWNFVHEMGALEFIDYLMDAKVDTEFEVLNYFYQKSGEKFSSPAEIVKRFSNKFAEIEDALSV